MRITIAVIAVALFVIHSAHVQTPIEAQSASPSSAILKLTVDGFAIPGQLFAWLGKVVKQDGTRLLPQRSQSTPDWWKP